MQTATPDAHGIAVIIVIVVALFLFTRDRLPLESSSLAVIVALTLGFHLFPYESDGAIVAPADFLIGFGNQALVAICSLIVRSGLTKSARRFASRLRYKAWLRSIRYASPSWVCLISSQ